MAERDGARRRRSYRGLVLVVPLLGGAFAACDDDTCDAGTCVDESGMRLLDRVCDVPLPEGPACEVSGDAVETTGPTADSLGFRLGDGRGQLTIHLAAIEGATLSEGFFDIEVLAAARGPASAELTAVFTWGSCAQACPVDPAPYSIEITDEPRWTTVVANQTAAGSALPYDAVLTLDGAGVDIIDMRSTSVYPESCSISGPVGARR